MKRKIAASLIGLCFLGALALHAFFTWGAMDDLPTKLSQEDKEFFEFSLFLESFGMAVVVSYIVGPRIYRAFGETYSALAYSSQRKSMKDLIDVYAGTAIILRRLSFDQMANVSLSQTLLVIAIASIPILKLLRRKLIQRKQKSEPVGI